MTRRALRGIAADQGGLALIEFAITLPVLILLFFGAYQLLDASACKRRVTITARALADITSQSEKVTPADLDKTLAASTQIMTPYDVNSATMRVSQVTVDALLQPKVAWSEALRTTELTEGSTFNALPASMRIPGANYILAEVSYNYDRHLGKLIPALTFQQTLYMLPRKSLSVDCDTCS